MSNLKFNKIGIIKYPDFINVTSIYLGKLRDLYNVELNLKNPKYKRGDRSEFVNILGIKGELIVQHFLFQNQIQFSYSDILASKPVGTADIQISNEIRIDVKTINDGAPDLLVNDEAHRKEKNITHYWFVQPYVNDNNGKSLTVAGYWIYSKEEVDDWDIKSVKYTDAYYKEIKTIINEK